MGKILEGTGLTFEKPARGSIAVRRISMTSMTPLRVAQASPAPSSQPSSRQSEAAESGTSALEEVVVTAQFRTERLQETPIAITALNAESMEARNMSRITDISDTAPNVVMKPANGPYGPAAQVFIRGVGQYDSSFALEPGVGIYVDDVYRGVVFGGVLDLLDLDRVEILRGPQGTLAGKNSIGGAIKLFTTKPQGDGSGYAEVTAGDFDRLDLKASADFAIVPDRLFARISGVTRHREGHVTRLDYGCLHPGSGVPSAVTNAQDCVIGTEGGQDYTAGRVALRWLPSDDLEINVAVNRLDEDSEPLANKLIALNLSPAAVGGLRGANPAAFITGPEEYTNYSTDIVLPFTDPAIYTGRPGAGSHAAIAMPPGVRLSSVEYAGTVDWKLGESLALKSITAYQDISGSYVNDSDATPYTIIQGDFFNGHRQFTQELRLNGGAFGGVVDWTLGAYYYDATSRIKGVNYLQVGLPIENLNSPNDTIITTSRSGFAHAVWHVTDQLNVTSGLRYTDDEKSYQYQRLNPFVAGIPTYTPAGVLTGTRSVYAGNRWDYRVNTSYQWTPDVMTYAQFSTGYRGGGVNPRPFVPEQAVPFDPETLNAYEIGVKSDFFDNRMRVNVSAFFNKYQDIIFINSSPSATSTQNVTPTNAGDAEIQGVEVELTLRPIGGLLIDASASWLDFQLKRIGAASAFSTRSTSAAQAR
jgi:iron complex outermembrane receptor protein